MLHDRFQRRIDYLRISVTDKCNLRCQYCMPAGGISLKRHEEILTLEEIAAVARYAVGQGITKIRLTGGEPLVRKNIGYLVGEIAAIPQLRDFGMTTNGTLLAEHATELKRRGLHRVNVSIDSLDAARYQEITCGGDLRAVLAGIEAAQKAGLAPVKLNVVIIPGFNDDEKEAFIAFGRANDLDVRFIPRMDLATGVRSHVECSAQQTTVGRCELCNRLRLTCDGLVKPCLFSEQGFPVRILGIEESFARALDSKPDAGGSNRREWMYQIGG